MKHTSVSLADVAASLVIIDQIAAARQMAALRQRGALTDTTHLSASGTTG